MLFTTLMFRLNQETHQFVNMNTAIPKAVFCRVNVGVFMAAMIALPKQLVTCQLGELRGDHPSSARVQRAEKFHL